MEETGKLISLKSIFSGDYYSLDTGWATLNLREL